MEATLVYLLKANVVLVLFAAAYYGLLRRLTFFGLNRVYLLVALVFAAVYPALPMPGLLPAAAPTSAGLPATWVLAELPTATASAPAATGFDWLAVGLLVYAAGAAVLLGRLLVQLVALARPHRTTRPATTATGVPYRQLPAPGDPFSFGRTIYLHAGQHSAAELTVVLAHEQAHVHQHHTADVLLAHLGTALFWVNPAVWLLRRALLDNLEYLADAATLRTGLDRRAYQYCLLNLSCGPVGPALALPFTFLTLKNRVAMMNTPLSSNGQLARYFLAGPLVILVALGYSAAHARSPEPVVASAASPATPGTAAPRALLAPATTPTASSSLPAQKTHQSVSPTLPLATQPALTSLPKAQPTASPAAVTRTVQTGPTSLYYLDGQPITETQYRALKQADIASIQILKGEQARQMDGDKGNNGIVVITSEANKDTWAVLNFNRRVQRIAPLPVANASANPKQLPSDALYYLDGQPSTQQAVEQVAVKDLADMQILKEPASIHQLPGAANSTAPVAILVTTKDNTDAPAVRAFADEADLVSAYFLSLVSVNVLRSNALAYITNHYPDARIIQVKEQKRKTTGEVKYQVWLATGKRPFGVFFTTQGEFAGEVKSRYL